MTRTVPYDEIADWYQKEFLTRTTAAGADPLGIARAPQELLGESTGICLEIGCGTGVHASQVREPGWAPTGVDLSVSKGDCALHGCGGYAGQIVASAGVSFPHIGVKIPRQSQH
jgi:predicted TPR repeat methyltransferase